MSEQSDTPRTDALKIPSEALLLLGNKGVPAQIVKAILTLGDHARSLERELSEVTRERSQLLTWREIDKDARTGLLEARSAAETALVAAERELEELHEALRLAHSHLDMSALAISHKKDAALIVAALATPPEKQQKDGHLTVVPSNQSASSEVRGTQCGSLAVIEDLLALTDALYFTLEDSEQVSNDSHVIQDADFQKLVAITERLDALPDSRPGYVMSYNGKARWALRWVVRSLLAVRTSDATAHRSNENDVSAPPEK